MTDRELLGLAARAAGYLVQKRTEVVDCDDRLIGVRVRLSDRDKYETWNPLQDNGDALRLAVKLNLLYGKVFARSVPEYHEDGDDIYVATRRAIVRAAAEIGRGMSC